MRIRWITMIIVLGMAGAAFGQEAVPVMGNWQGTFAGADWKDRGLRAQIVGDSWQDYHALVYVSQGGTEKLGGIIKGRTETQITRFAGEVDLGADLEGTFTVTGQAAKGVFTGEFKSASRTEAFEMKRVILSSPTLGMKPEGATVLLDGAKETFQNKWIIQPRWMTQSDGSIQTTGSSIVTKDSFGSVELHVEFMTPYMPNDRGQARGNSGVYVAGRYEVQVLDSFADKPANNLCGGIYQIATPIASACLPPLEWQTYDITYRAPKFDSENKKPQNAQTTPRSLPAS